MPEPLTLERLIDALSELGAVARAAGKVIDIAIYGGSCLILASNFRVTTADVDAVAASDQGFIDDAARMIATRRNWPPDWLNDGVRTYLSPRVEPPDHHELLRAYPSEAEPGLRVFVPTAEYVLAMKLMAMRIDTASGRKDLADILNLLAVTGIKEKSEIVQFAAAFYPEARASGRLLLSIEELWRAHEKRAQESSDEAPRYLGRSGPPR
jgi:hypothetical protein